MGYRDTLDSRDIQKDIDNLEEIEERNEDEQEELDKLQAFKDSVDSSEWDSGITFISEEYFEEYARDFAEDIGTISKDTQWPATHIDWDAAASELLIDYVAVELDGITYYYR